jgi:hypothetical protein
VRGGITEDAVNLANDAFLKRQAGEKQRSLSDGNKKGRILLVLVTSRPFVLKHSGHFLCITKQMFRYEYEPSLT